MKEADFFRSRSSDGRKMRFRAFPAVEMLKTFNYEAPKTLRPGSKLMLLPPLGGPAVNYSVGLTLMPMVYTSLHPVPWGGRVLDSNLYSGVPKFFSLVQNFSLETIPEISEKRILHNGKIRLSNYPI